MEFVAAGAPERKLSARTPAPRSGASQRSDWAIDPIRIEGKFFAQGCHRLRLQGVTYGPFAENDAGAPFPSIRQVRLDLQAMRDASINALRTYHVPPPWMLDLAEEQGHHVLMDIPWAKHVCFLDSTSAQAEARRAVRSAVQKSWSHPCVLGYSIGNEIPANIVRWHGARRVERFLRELADVARQIHSRALVTYANYPSTEYLDLSFADFITFNVYLHDRAVFRRYLHRLQNLVGDKPLVLGELGMDTLRHGQLAQAAFLQGHLYEAVLMGLAGAFVFSWTDDWFTGGHQIEDWTFGITDKRREPKAAYHEVREVFETPPGSMLCSRPKVSVVVCTYNGGSTLQQCLRSLLAVDYPDFEVIVVDDGSKDSTPKILEQFPEVQIIRQENRGLSAARNVGLYAATGEIVAYTDSDCFADRDWLTLLVDQLQRSGAAAVGGPNLTPDDGWLASCVAASPGQPMHVLESEQVAEHIPGCNMAFRREALLAINGFDEQYRKAGDDVDICWRLQQSGDWITFAPGAFVWHHRRQTPGAYLRQQAGYGEAESLLRFQHPERFNSRGEGKWSGSLYGASLQGLCLDRPIIYRGAFGAALFQCIYQPRPAHWAMMPATLEWHVAVGLCCVIAGIWPAALIVALLMWGASLLVAALQSAQAKIPRKYDGPFSRLIVMLLCYTQPLVRSWHRQMTQVLSHRRAAAGGTTANPPLRRMLKLRGAIKVFWGEQGVDRLRFLDRAVCHLNQRQWSKVLDAGWDSWDIHVFCHPWVVARIATAQEEHGGGRRLIRVRCAARPSGYTLLLCAIAMAVALLGMLRGSAPYLSAGAILAILGGIAYWRGLCRATAVRDLMDSIAAELGLVECDSATSELRTNPLANSPVIPLAELEATSPVASTDSALACKRGDETGQLLTLRSGFTLVELLVVVGIIGIMAALLLPAVQQARESSRRTQCANHVKQLGLAFHAHHDELRYLPSAGWDWWEPPTFRNGAPAVGPDQRASWAFQILPYMEAQATWNGGNGSTDIGRALAAVGTPNQLFFCPSRRRPQAVTYSDPGYMGGITVKHALCDYAGSNLEETGAIRRYLPVRLAEITDGLSSTLLVGDKRLNRHTLGKWQEDDNEGYTAGWDEDTMRHTDLPPAADYGRPTGDGEQRFGSSHPAAFNVGLADGSVHTLSYTIDATVFTRLGHKSDGNSINPF